MIVYYDHIQPRSSHSRSRHAPHILEALPLDERQRVSNLVRAKNDGETLRKVSDLARESLIHTMDKAERLVAAESLDADEIAHIAAFDRQMDYAPMLR